ncbi:MAG: biopolymer transporter ExbD [Calditrichaceae bacterium]|nr:biopolymer transporter ExbD [Calditrichaceae bacterium]MBN2708880.1 biopolymer transporter ExbD [Calditrichaceae bacterium]RQV97594.1 MAG: biopolymer transporter ExbD [Calditrichota bacterium]
MFLSKTNHREPEIPTSSLADIVFLLLIFFLVTTSIDTEKALGLILPGIEDTERPLPQEMIFEILINDDNLLAVEGEPRTIYELGRDLKGELADNPDLVVSLKTGSHTDYQIYVTVLDKIKEIYGDKKPLISVVAPDVN